jgi:hypothetical protein
MSPLSELGGDARRLGVKRDIELNLLDEVGGRRIVFEQLGLADRLIHELGTIPSPSLLEGGARDAKSSGAIFA